MRTLKLFLVLSTFMVTLPVFLYGQEAMLFKPSECRKVLQNICTAIDRYYVFPSQSELMSKQLMHLAEVGKYDTLNDPIILADQVTHDLRLVYYDRHLRIEYNPKLERDIVSFLASKRGADKISAAEIGRDERKNFNFRKLEILPGNIGYIELTGFTPTSPTALKTIHAAMQFVSHTDALIIDLRNNFGGSGNSDIVSYFFNKKTYVGRSFNRIENKWSDQYIENMKAVTQGIVLTMPVYILTSSRTFSAAEGFAYTLQNLRDAIIVGDTTRGGAHLTRSFSLGDGFVAFIPYLRHENTKTKTDWEGTGVVPNVSTDEAKSLIVAHNLILNKKLKDETDEIRKKELQYLMNWNTAKYAAVAISHSHASAFTGQFAEFKIMSLENQLMLQDVNQSNNSSIKMIAITPFLFQVGNDYQVEFLSNDSGAYNSVKITWPDGWQEIIKRTR